MQKTKIHGLFQDKSAVEARQIRTFVSFFAIIFVFAALIGSPKPAQARETPVAPESRVISLGTCALESGAAIEDCKLAVTTIGTLSATRDNAIVFPTWYGGKAEQLLKYIGPDKLVDTTRFFVILIDSPGNGVSSSPSNSVTQASSKFPAVSIRDMVRMQKRLINEQFKLESVHAVMGISMGAMQALEWAVWQPEFAKKFVAIAGSPRLATYDIVLWETYQRLWQTVVECQCQRPMEVMAGLRVLMRGPEHQAVRAPEAREKVRGDIARQNLDVKAAPDRIVQLNAMIGHDVARHSGGDLSVAAQRVGAKLLAIVGGRDDIVTPAPLREFAKAAGQPAIEIAECGHDIPQCGSHIAFPVTREFLAR
jgi:homoserine O-acetyltransferase/O-succinyltransferase